MSELFCFVLFFVGTPLWEDGIQEQPYLFMQKQKTNKSLFFHTSKYNSKNITFTFKQ